MLSIFISLFLRSIHWNMFINDTIIALATAAGSSAIAVIRLSGSNAITITDKNFISKSGKSLKQKGTHTITLGHIVDGERYIDEVLVSVFRNPKSYTGEDTVEISCHGSSYIQSEIIRLFLSKGCRVARAGEFTLRSFLNAKLDLSQAEAVADLIASDNKAAHQLAMQQMRGGFSNDLKSLRAELVNFASLIELELDFSEEDVEFADRNKFNSLLDEIVQTLKKLIDSFASGSVLKDGIPTAIVGAPNAGKSTLLNTLLNDEKAIVSHIAGTTRDAIEDELSIEGIKFRFIDTAGIRTTEDMVENIGIKKTFEKMSQAQAILYIIDANEISPNTTKEIQNRIKQINVEYKDKKIILIINKIDQVNPENLIDFCKDLDPIMLSAKSGKGVEILQKRLLGMANTGLLNSGDTVITNVRHYEALTKALIEIQNVQTGLESQIPGDLLAIDIRQALYHIGEITGEITSDDLLGNIFSNFCIGK